MAYFLISTLKRVTIANFWYKITKAIKLTCKRLREEQTRWKKINTYNIRKFVSINQIQNLHVLISTIFCVNTLDESIALFCFSWPSIWYFKKSIICGRKTQNKIINPPVLIFHHEIIIIQASISLLLPFLTLVLYSKFKIIRCQNVLVGNAKTIWNFSLTVQA